MALGGLMSLSGTSLFSQNSTKAGQRIRALLVTGGCCHDYEAQKEITMGTINSGTQFDIEWDIRFPGIKDYAAVEAFFSNPKWSEGYDIVIHNQCYANMGDDAFIEKVFTPHRNGLPAVVIHCALHSFRANKAAHLKWHEFCGAASARHGPKHPFKVELLEPEHEALSGMANWTTPAGELYYVHKVFPTATPLAHSKSNKTGEMNVNIWANEFGSNKTRVFGTTIGHHNETMMQAEYMNMLSRGFTWALNQPVKKYVS